MENTDNKSCSKWCSNPKNWLRWAIGLAILVLVFSLGCAAGRFSSFKRSNMRGFERGGFEQGGYGRPMMRGGRNYGNFAPGYADGTAPADQAGQTTNQPAPTTTTTVPAKQ